MKDQKAKQSKPSCGFYFWGMRRNIIGQMSVYLCQAVESQG